MSLNQSMNISLGSMKNYQYALTVVSQNIANLHVEDYHRQRVDFQTNEYTTNCENVLSTIRGMNGASIASLSDFVDDAKFRDLIDSNSDANYYNTLADALGELEDIADELGDNGLNGLLNDFYAAAANLEQFPADLTVRQQYVLAAQNVCDKFNDISNKYNAVQEDKINTVQSDIGRINSLLNELAQFNEIHVKNNQSSQTKSDINAILEELSNYMKVSTTTNDNGSINVVFDGREIVRGNEVKFVLEGEFDPANPDKVVGISLKSTEDENWVINKNVNDLFTSGSMKAHLEFLNGTNPTCVSLQDLKGALDDAANAFANALNEIQTFGSIAQGVFAASITTENGNLILQEATEPMFTSKDGQAFNAGNIQVNLNIIENPFLVSAARINLADYTDENGVVDPNWKFAIGNSDNATEITALQNKKICSVGDGANNCTLSQFLINNAAKIGLDKASTDAKASTAQDIADADATNFANMVGVNLDEELADMIKYQRSYEASAKLFSTINDLMGTIINMV